jgi:hypothetical protein
MCDYRTCSAGSPLRHSFDAAEAFLTQLHYRERRAAATHRLCKEKRAPARKRL